MLNQPSQSLAAIIQRSRLAPNWITSVTASAAITPSTPSSHSPLNPPTQSASPLAKPVMAAVDTAVRSQHQHVPTSSHAGPNPGEQTDDIKEISTDQNRPWPPRFPLGYKDAAYQWWSSLTPSMAEAKVLSFVPHLKPVGELDSDPSMADSEWHDAYGKRTISRSHVQLSGKSRAINEVCVERVGEEVEDNVVMLHGYGAGLGLFYRNLEPISRVPGVKLFALDLLGMGNSSRPPFKMISKTKEDKVIEAENWFIDALEEWRAVRKIERFTLVGHSLGGYLAVSYAVKYPGHLKKLILASPVGVPENPYAVDASMPEPTESTVQNEVIVDQIDVTKNDTADQVKNQKTADTTNPTDAPKRTMPGWFVWLWDANISPFSLVRNAGPLGPRFMSGWSSRRFNHLPTREATVLHEYAFSIFKQKGSGEYALSHILAPGAYARRPILNRIHEVGRQTVKKPDGTEGQENGIPIVFMYGDSDWMDVAGGKAAEEKLHQHREKVLENGTEAERRSEKGSSRLIVVPKAGHNIFLDNPPSFNQFITEELMKTKQMEKDTSKA